MDKINMKIDSDFLKKIEELVDDEIDLDYIDYEYRGNLPGNTKDSFCNFYLNTRSEPEDAIWERDLKKNYFTGLKVGIRNTLKVLKEHPELLDSLMKNDGDQNV